jgi:hypothetical protein
LRHAVFNQLAVYFLFYYREMPLFKAVKQNVLSRTSIATAIEGDALYKGAQGLLSFGRVPMTDIKDQQGSEGPFPPIAKEINHAV